MRSRSEARIGYFATHASATVVRAINVWDTVVRAIDVWDTVVRHARNACATVEERRFQRRVAPGRIPRALAPVVAFPTPNLNPCNHIRSQNGNPTNHSRSTVFLHVENPAPTPHQARHC